MYIIGKSLASILVSLDYRQVSRQYSGEFIGKSLTSILINLDNRQVSRRNSDQFRQ